MGSIVFRYSSNIEIAPLFYFYNKTDQTTWTYHIWIKLAFINIELTKYAQT